MALAVMLLAGAGLLIRSFTKLASVDPGFHATQALTFELSLPDSRYEQEPQQVGFFDQLLPRLRAIPGVQSAAAAMSLPLERLELRSDVRGGRPSSRSAEPATRDADSRRDARVLSDDRDPAQARAIVHRR